MTNTTKTASDSGKGWEAVCWDVGPKTARETAAYYTGEGYQVDVKHKGAAFGFTVYVRRPEAL